jgi:hypothetical protein
VKRTPLAALALLVAVACIGCSDDPEPDFAPPESTSPAPADPTSSTTSAPPDLPADAQKNSARGAEAFVKFFWRMVNYAQTSGETESLSALANPRCKACSAGVQYLDDVFARGGVITGGATRVSDVRSRPFQIGSSSGYAVTAVVRNTKQSVDFPGDSSDESYPADTISTRFFVEWTPEGWSVAVWEQT